ncbi:MAG: LCP family protein [Candidatus Nomurabacteria bacterium]|nr:MAG: LCP family protein [Candidatus Nomurabacteria bacterium]
MPAPRAKKTTKKNPPKQASEKIAEAQIIIPEASPAIEIPKTATPHFFGWKFFVVLGIITGLSMGFATFSRVIDPPNTNGAVGTEQLSLLQHINQLVENQNRPLQGESRDRVNILLLGIGGEGHEGALLADTIILASLQPSTGKIALLSIPRDFYVPIPGYDWRKINNANAFGEVDDYPGGGERLTADVLEDILDVDIPYTARIDFNGFIQMVDNLGGISVDVEKGFVDTRYPTENYGYQTIRFDAGRQTMDGETALKFVRSRKSTSDFDRSRRQQLVLLALRQKALNFGTLINPSRISDVLGSLSSNAHTNMELWEILRLAELVEDADTTNIINVILDSSADSPLMDDRTTVDNAYIVRPRKGWDDWSELQDIANNIFQREGEAQPLTASVVVQNGTRTVGLASETADILESYGLEVIDIGNTSVRGYTQTYIYDISNGEKAMALAALRQALPFAHVYSKTPLYLNPDALLTTDLSGRITEIAVELQQETHPDFVVILGDDTDPDVLLSHSKTSSSSLITSR